MMRLLVRASEMMKTSSSVPDSNSFPSLLKEAPGGGVGRAVPAQVAGRGGGAPGRAAGAPQPPGPPNRPAKGAPAGLRPTAPAKPAADAAWLKSAGPTEAAADTTGL